MKKRRSTAKGDTLSVIAQLDPKQAKEQLKKSLADIAYDDISASFLWGQGPKRQESGVLEPDKRRSVARMDSQGDSRPESYNPDVATSLHVKHALSSVKEGNNLIEELNIEEEGEEGRESSHLKGPVIFKGNLLKKSPSMFKGWQKR